MSLAQGDHEDGVVHPAEDGLSDDGSSGSSSSSSSASSSQVSEYPIGRNEDADGDGEQGVFVPPGQGTSRTRRNNRVRRQKKRKAHEEEQEAQFASAVERSHKRQAGEALDEESILHDWHSSPAQRKSMPSDRRAEEHAAESPQRYIKPVPPPSMRPDPIPEGVRLRRVDCDDCFNPWPDEEGSEGDGQEKEQEQYGEEFEGDSGIDGQMDEAYAIFQARAKQELKRMQEEEEAAAEKQEQGPELDYGTLESDANPPNHDGTNAALAAAMGMPMSFGKSKGWDGNQLL